MIRKTMRIAGVNDKELVIKILTQSFIKDPHITFLLEKSNNRNKLEIIMNYVFEETLAKGEIYINESNTAVALWLTQRKEQITMKFLQRNLSFLFQVGIAATYRILKMEGLVNRVYPKSSNFKHLYLIGVLPENQGKGYAKQLINKMIEESERTKIPLYLETANINNVTIYKRLGFDVFTQIKINDHTLFCLNRSFEKAIG
jgi:ribosomal protein S18 acetylase RimI-like enzyme